MHILTPVIIMALLGGLFAFLLGVVSKLTYVPVDPKITEIRNVLPGANCGACGYPGCDGCAEAMAKGEATVTACVVGGEKCAKKIADIMGTDSDGAQKMVASVKCHGTLDHTKRTYSYDGVTSCTLMTYTFGGCKSCVYGCLGCGDCEKVCDFDAIRIVNGIAVIDQDKCTSCQKCIKTCPKHIIELVPYDAPAQVKCKNIEFGKDVKAQCGVGCIGCGVCARLAPNEFALEGKLAHAVYSDDFDIEKAKMAAAKCPAKCIIINEKYLTPEEPKEEKEAVNA